MQTTVWGVVPSDNLSTSYVWESRQRSVGFVPLCFQPIGAARALNGVERVARLIVDGVIRYLDSENNRRNGEKSKSEEFHGEGKARARRGETSRVLQSRVVEHSSYTSRLRARSNVNVLRSATLWTQTS